MSHRGPIADAVTDAIRRVRDAHDLTPSTSPTSTVAIARWSDDVVETYALGDSYVVVLRADGTESVHTDDRLDAVGAPERAAYRTRLAAGHGYDVGHHGIATTDGRSGITALLLASDGVDPERYPQAVDWRGLADDAYRHGEARVLQDIHDAEAVDADGRRWPRSKPHDDKTLVTVSF
jgi:hypothetical protein